MTSDSISGLYADPGSTRSSPGVLSPGDYLIAPLDAIRPLIWQASRLFRVPQSRGLLVGADVPVRRLTDADGSPWLLLGHCSQTAGRHGVVEASFREIEGSSIAGWVATWSGRWLLIGETEILNDAGGLLPLFYTVDRSPQIASNSLRLMQELVPLQRISGRTLYQGMGLDWFPPPLTQWDGARKLLASQSFDLQRWSPRPAQILSCPECVFNSLEDVAEQAAHTLAEAMLALAVHTGTNWLAITAGIDSRTLLAVARHREIPLRTYTLTYPGMSAHEITLGRRLAELAGYSHLAVPSRSRPRKPAVRYFDRHTQERVVEYDRRWVPAGHYGFASEADMLFRGSGFEIGRCFYWDTFGEHPGAVPPPPPVIARAMGMRRLNPRLEQGIKAWSAWVQESPVPVHDELIDWRDRFYWEQRMGGWLADIEQALELIPAATVHPANCASFMGLLLLPSTQQRRTGALQREIIRQTCPKLLDLPINPPDVARHPVRMKARHYGRRLRFEANLVAATFVEGLFPSRYADNS